MIRFTPARPLALLLAALAVGCGGGDPIVFDTATGAGGAGGSMPGTGGEGGVITGAACTLGAQRACYTGPAGTDVFGICKAGTQTCDASGAWGPCAGEILPATESCATPLDEDCDGLINEPDAGCACDPGAVMPCYGGPAGTEGKGACKAGTITCADDGLGYGPCVGDVVPADETCETPVDDDCDGQINEGGQGCACKPGEVTSCYDAPAGTEGVGPCKAGQATCNAQGTDFGPCVGAVTPAPETCQTPIDDDCDGAVNEEGMGCLCAPGSTAPCYEGPPNTSGIGACKAGVQTCGESGLMYGACVGQTLPAAESCNTPDDDDCDGQANEGCPCAPGSTAPCYTGPAGTEGKGICKAGIKTCSAQGMYGACSGDVTPLVEACNNIVDEDCDGALDNGCSWTSCLALKQAMPATPSGEYTIDTDGAGPLPSVKARCDMTTDGGGYTLVRLDDAALGNTQSAYAAKCASVGMEVVVTRTKAHAQSLFAWNGNQQANLLNVFPKNNGAQGIQNWQGICKGASCGFWMTDNANGDVGCTTFEPSGDNTTSSRIYRRTTGCGLQGNWNDQNNFVQITGWVICSTNDK